MPPALLAPPPEAAAVPITVDDREVGVLIGARRGAEATTQTQVLLQALAGQLALGLRNVELTHEKAELAAAAERARLAREIHDGVAQSLYMLALNLEAAADVADQGASLRPRLEQLLGLARQALWEVRHYIFDLKPLLGDDAPLADVLRNPLREFQTITGVGTELRVEGEERPLEPRARAAVYRVLQEALANIFKHARASRADVCVRWDPTELLLEIRDDGQGFAVDQARSGHGLQNLTQRAAEVGGTALVISTPGAGTTVRLTVPYSARTTSPSLQGRGSGG
jgi:two-component system sensor histidine kinase DegS